MSDTPRPVAVSASRSHCESVFHERLRSGMGNRIADPAASGLDSRPAFSDALAVSLRNARLGGRAMSDAPEPPLLRHWGKHRRPPRRSPPRWIWLLLAVSAVGALVL